jgi:hypothetical protein
MIEHALMVIASLYEESGTSEGSREGKKVGLEAR